MSPLLLVFSIRVWDLFPLFWWVSFFFSCWVTRSDLTTLPQTSALFFFLLRFFFLALPLFGANSLPQRSRLSPESQPHPRLLSHALTSMSPFFRGWLFAFLSFFPPPTLKVKFWFFFPVFLNGTSHPPYPQLILFPFSPLSFSPPLLFPPPFTSERIFTLFSPLLFP